MVDDAKYTEVPNVFLFTSGREFEPPRSVCLV